MSPLIAIAAVTAVIGSAWLWVAQTQCAPTRARLGNGYYYTALTICGLFYTVATFCLVALALR